MPAKWSFSPRWNHSGTDLRSWITWLPLTIHPILTAQVDLLNYTFKKDKYPWLEFKVTIAPQLDFYGRFTGKEEQFQWPLQPNVEWHLNESYSAVFQVSIRMCCNFVVEPKFGEDDRKFSSSQ